MSLLDGGVVGMATERRCHGFDVSEMLFRLATECVHLHSNDEKQMATLGDVIVTRAARAADGFPGQESETLRGHLTTAPTAGKVRIDFEICANTDMLLATGQARLAERLGVPVSLCDTVSLLLFDFSVDRAAASMLDGLLGEERRKGGERPAGPKGDDDGKVVPIR